MSSDGMLVGVTDVALRLVPTVAELKHSFHLSFSISQVSFPITRAEANDKWQMASGNER